MANKIIIKRGADANVSSLTPASIGEPVWGTSDNKFYVASGTSAGNFEWVGASILDQDTLSSDSATSLATQQSIKAYVDAQVTAQDLDFSTDTGTGAVDLDSQTLAFTSGEGVNITHSSQAVTIAGELATASNAGVAFFPTTDFAVTSGSVAIKAGGVTNTQLANSTVTVSDSSNTSPVALGGTLTIQGTSNEVTVAEDAGTFTVGLPDDVTIGGDLTVNGTMTTANAQQVELGDVNIMMAKDNSANSVDIGLFGKYVSSGTKYKGMFSDQDNSDVWTFFKGTGTEPANTVNTGASGYVLAGISCASVDNATLDGGTF